MLLKFSLFSLLTVSLPCIQSSIPTKLQNLFVYQYNFSGDGDRACEFLSFEHTHDFDISDDELAKSHPRYMIGGCHAVPNEHIFRFGMIHPHPSANLACQDA